MRKIIRIAVFTAIVLSILSAGLFYAAYSRYRRAESENPPVKNTGVSVTPSKQVSLGQPVCFEYTLEVPWNKKPSGIKVSPGQGSQVTGAPEISKTRTRWGYDVWTAKCMLQPFTTGDIPAGKVSVSFIPETSGGTNVLSLDIPSFKSLEITGLKDGPSLASRLQVVEERKKARIWIYMILAVILAAGLVWFYYNRRKRNSVPVPLTPWAKALLNLTDLNDCFNKGQMGVVVCVTRLTDIVRNYLEERFSIHAPRQTTAEFLRSMEISSSPLNNRDRNFLKDFMTSADMIKFAKYEAEKELVMNSIERASQLVAETIPNDKVDG